MSGNQSITPLKIIASGVALPEHKILSSMLDEKLNKSKGFVEKHSGIEYRFHASHTDSQALLAAQAIQNALQANHIPPNSIDMLINASARYRVQQRISLSNRI